MNGHFNDEREREVLLILCEHLQQENALGLGVWSLREGHGHGHGWSRRGWPHLPWRAHGRKAFHFERRNLRLCFVFWV